MKFSLAKLTIKRPVSTIMVVLMVIVLGVSAFLDIPKDLMPEMELPYALVMTSYPNASPEEVESMVTVTVEQALAQVENLSDMISYSLENTSVVLIQFNFGTDMNFASLDMREKISLIEDYLPDTCSQPMVMKLNMNALPTMQVYVSADLPLEELNSIVEDNVVSYFERSSGVASVSVNGGLEEEISIVFSQENLTNYGLTLQTIAQILAAENINLPSGNVSRGDSKVIVRTMGMFTSAEELGNIPLMTSDYSKVRLADVATITQGAGKQESITRINGKTAVGIMITKQSDANTVKVSQALKKELARVQAKYPQLNFIVGYDAADFINASLSSVGRSAIIGAVLAVLVVFIFLRNVRSTMVIGISIPLCILLTFAVMNFRHITLNLVTLCSLAIAVGMIVDNSIVVLENIYSTRMKMGSAKEAAEYGTGEVFLAIVASTVTTVLVFLPIALTDGLASIMFGDFCLTIIIALLASLLVAVTVVPMLCSKLMQGNISTDYVRVGRVRYKYKLLPLFNRGLQNLISWYEGVIRRALKKRGRVLLVCFLVFGLSLGLLAMVGTELLPASDEGSINISVDVPYGTSLATTDKLMSQVEDYILQLPEVRYVSMNTSSISALSLGGGASFTVGLCSRTERDRTTDEVAKDIDNFAKNITGIDVSAASSSSIMGMFGDSDIAIYVMGKDLDKLEEVGRDIAARASHLDLVESAELDITEGSPEIKVLINRGTASFYGVTAYQLASGLSGALNGVTATNVSIDGEDIAVKLSLSDYYADSIENMKQIVINGNYGTPVTVGQIASFEFDNSPANITRYNQSRYFIVNAAIQGDSLAAASEQVQAMLDAYPFPDGYSYEIQGLADTMAEMFGSLFKALIVAIALVFLVLAAQFESMTMAFIVMMAIPFAMTGAFIAMFLTGTKMSLTSLLGLVLLVGTVVNNSILLVEFINQNKHSMGREEAMVAAGKQRLRPILMTTLTTIVGMIPLSLGYGEGGEILAPMGISIIGGLLTSTLLTLIVIPCMYKLVEERRDASAAKAEARAAEIAALEAKWAEEDAKGN